MLINSILLLLLSNAVTSKREKSIFYSRLAIIILVISFLLGIESLYIIHLEKGIALYGGLFHITANTQTFHIFIYGISAIILQLTAFYPRKIFYNVENSISKIFINFKIEEKKGEEFKIMEFPIIILFIIIGAILLISSNDLVSIFLSIELQSYGLYLLSTLYRNSELATTSGLTYFLLGGLSSCFILLGASLLYTNSGTTSLENLYVITSISDMVQDNTNNVLYWYKPYYINISLLIMSVGFLFKISAAPFHLWSPEVYDGIPTIVTTFVAIIAKISIFMFFLELVHYTSNSFFTTSKFTWIYILLISSLLSLIIGTIVGLTQFRIKRLYAYSTISHIGFILLALGINSVESIQAFLFYLMQYSISNLNAFIILIGIGYSLFYHIYNNMEYDKLKDKYNSPIQLISQIKGYFYINPFLAISLLLTIFSFIGIPPLIGFFAKQMILSAALDNGYIFLTLIAILTSVIGAVYYLGIIKQVFFDKSEYKFEIISTRFTTDKDYINISILKDNDIFRLSSSLTFTISILTLIITLFIFMPQEWLSMANILAILLFNT